MSECVFDFEDYSLDLYALAIHAIAYLFLYYEHNLTLMYVLHIQISVMNTCFMQFDVKSVYMHRSTFYWTMFDTNAHWFSHDE